jgi:hypothetical protein
MTVECAAHRPGHGWNWASDGIPITPCLQGLYGGLCNHERREDAERHHWEAFIDSVRIESTTFARRPTIQLCGIVQCRQWQTHVAISPREALRGDIPLCGAHANVETVTRLIGDTARERVTGS